MLFTPYAYACLALLAGLASGGYVAESTLATDLEASKSSAKLNEVIQNGKLKELLASRGVQQECTPSKMAVRREYSTLSNDEKLAYINAVKCLMRAPSKIPAGEVPGAKSRYDDFVGMHVNQTLFIHFTGSFFAWHRYFVWSYERALRDECGYKDYLPYWNWGKSAKDPINSPYMDGGPYSQGGNGVWAPHECSPPAEGSPYCVPVVQGQGGGCVESGPYGRMIANISATSPTLLAPDAPKVGPYLGYQPRCMRRDISVDVSSKFSSDAKLLQILTDPMFQELGPFQDYFEAGTSTFPPGTFKDFDLGLHGGGHFTYMGDPSGDFHNSPNDPLFWIHHGMVDRTWWVWQNQKPLDRAFMLHGTRTFFNDPPSPNATIEDDLAMWWVAPKSPPSSILKHHVSVAGGPYCYTYA